MVEEYYNPGFIYAFGHGKHMIINENSLKNIHNLNEILYSVTDVLFDYKQITLDKYNRFRMWLSELINDIDAQYMQRVLPHGNVQCYLEYISNYDNYKINSPPVFPLNKLEDYCNDVLKQGNTLTTSDILSCTYQSYTLLKDFRTNTEGLYIEYIDFTQKMQVYINNKREMILNLKLILDLLGIGKLPTTKEGLLEILINDKPYTLRPEYLKILQSKIGIIDGIDANGVIYLNAYKSLIKHFKQYKKRVDVVDRVKIGEWNQLKGEFKPYIYNHPYKVIEKELNKHEGFINTLPKSPKSPSKKMVSSIKISDISKPKFNTRARTKETVRKLEAQKRQMNQNTQNSTQRPSDTKQTQRKLRVHRKQNNNINGNDSSDEDNNNNNNGNDVTDGEVEESESDSSDDEDNNNNNNNNNKTKGSNTRKRRRDNEEEVEGLVENITDDEDNEADNEAEDEFDDYTMEPPAKKQRLEKVRYCV